MRKCTDYLILSGILLGAVILFSCAYTRNRATMLESGSKSRTIHSPTKVHCFDGSVGVFPEGLIYDQGVGVSGHGILFDLTREHSEPVTSIPIEDIAFLEYYKLELEAGPVLATLGSAVVFLGAVSLNSEIHKWFFGSCPTIYTCEADTFSLQAECFSYSISEALETDDLDRINGAEARDGRLTLAVRNEAFETHYINLMELIVVDHPASFEAFPCNRQFPEAKEQILLLGEESPAMQVRSRDGRDVALLLQERDQLWYQSDTSVVEELTRRVFRDWIDVTVPAPASTDSMVVALRFRNTLFHTVEFYDLVLGEQGAAAVDWIGVEMADPLYAFGVYRDYRKYFGIRVDLLNGEGAREVAFIDDTGPIAWRQVAFSIPVSEEGEAHLRFSFLPDHVMLDWIGISFDHCNEYAVQTVRCSGLKGSGESTSDLRSALLHKSDEQYLISRPSDSWLVTFDVGPEPSARERTSFLRSGGYYVEWIRHAWLQAGSAVDRPASFVLNDTAIRRAADMWLHQKEIYESKFYATRIILEGGKRR